MTQKVRMLSPEDWRRFNARMMARPSFRVNQRLYDAGFDNVIDDDGTAVLPQSDDATSFVAELAQRDDIDWED